MPYDQTLTARIRDVLGERSDITERKMFGGVAFLCQGRMCCGVAGSDLIVRVVESAMPRALARRLWRRDHGEVERLTWPAATTNSQTSMKSRPRRRPQWRASPVKRLAHPAAGGNGRLSRLTP
jgi:hypothetical protein